jgi:hypothetical protein
MTSVIPAPAPPSEELATRIKKLATYVARNGIEFEHKVREKEGKNPQFQFLFDNSSEGHLYYKWMVYCTQHLYADDQIRCMEDNHAHRIEWRAPSGTLQLTIHDEADLQTLLQKNNGSKEAIKSTRKWILDRAHSIVHIGLVFCHFADQHARDNGSSAYSQLLHTAYIMNDVLYNAKLARSSGPYTRIAETDSPMDLVLLLKPYLGPLLRPCYMAAEEETQKEKVLRLIELWTGKGFLNQTEGEAIRESLMKGGDIPVPGPALVSPYLENPLPTNQTQITSVAPSAPSRNDAPAPSGLTEAQLSQLQLIQQRIQAQLAATKQTHTHMQQSQAQQLPQMSYGQPPQYQQPGFAVQQPLPPPGAPGAITGQHPQFIPHPVGGAAMQYGGPPGQYPPPAHFLQHAPPQPALFPFGAPPLPVMPMPVTPALDLAKLPVGNMVNIVKAAKRAGHTPHTTLDIAVYASHPVPHVEPGRLEVRVAEFYRCVEALLNPSLEVADRPEREREDTREAKYPVRRDGGDGRRDGEEGWERYVPGYEEERDRGQDSGWDQARARKAARYTNTSAPAVMAAEAQITEENVGHKLLRGLGWQEGRGLGAEGAGIVEPISAKASENRMGLGTAETDVPSLKDGTIDYASYRKQLSSHYHSRLGDR